MPIEIPVQADRLLSFLLVLARVSGAVAFVPIPGWRRAPEQARIVLALSLTMALFPVWPAPPKLAPSLGEVAGWAGLEVLWGGAIGLAVGIIVEGFVLAAQCIGLQAGFSYASTVDPSSDADTTVLQVIAQLTANLMFFAFRMDAELVRALAGSLSRHPPGTWTSKWSDWEEIVRLGAEMWRTALRLAIPILVLLLLIDLAVALYGKVQAQLQLMTLAFPLKIVVSLAALAMFAAATPGVFRHQMDQWILFAAR